MINMRELRDKAMRLASTDLPTAQLLQRCGDEIQQLTAQRDALLLALTKTTTTEPCDG